MASKTKKTTVTSSSSVSVSGMQTPQSSSTPRQGSRPPSVAGSAAGRSSSPLSPTRQTRMQEKFDLQNLNDRLAAYIDRVRHLEGENSRLTREVQTSQETVTREVSNIKGMYEHELADARRLLDETAREKAKLEIDSKRLFEENDDLRKRLDKKTKEFNVVENSCRVFETRVTDLNGKYNNAIGERKKAQDEAAELAKEVANLRKLLADTRKVQEEETLCRIDLENTLQSLREELQFKDQVYQQELTEIRTRRQVEISEIDGRLSQQYEAKQQQALQELREQQEATIRGNRDELESRYDAKLKALQAAANRNSHATGLAVEELRSARMQVDGLNLRISELESQNSALTNRCRELEKNLQNERAQHASDLAQMEDELGRLRDKMNDQLEEYAALMDIKCSLDLEIATYRKLLEGEEDRLNLTPGSPSESMQSKSVSGLRRSTPMRTNVRKRMLLDESEERSVHDFSVTSSATGDIEISETCPNGTFIKIHNKGKKEISLSGWQIVRKAGLLETVFKFHRSVKIEAGGVITIWSEDAGQEHNPPHNIVMKSKKWFVSDHMSTVLINNADEEVAQSERQRQQVSTSSLRHREMQHKIPRHDLLGQHQGEQLDEKCSLM